MSILSFLNESTKFEKNKNLGREFEKYGESVFQKKKKTPTRGAV